MYHIGLSSLGGKTLYRQRSCFWNNRNELTFYNRKTKMTVNSLPHTERFCKLTWVSGPRGGRTADGGPLGIFDAVYPTKLKDTKYGSGRLLMWTLCRGDRLSKKKGTTSKLLAAQVAEQSLRFSLGNSSRNTGTCVFARRWLELLFLQWFVVFQPLIVQGKEDGALSCFCIGDYLLFTLSLSVEAS